MILRHPRWRGNMGATLTSEDDRYLRSKAAKNQAPYCTIRTARCMPGWWGGYYGLQFIVGCHLFHQWVLLHTTDRQADNCYLADVQAEGRHALPVLWHSALAHPSSLIMSPSWTWLAAVPYALHAHHFRTLRSPATPLP